MTNSEHDNRKQTILGAGGSIGIELAKALKDYTSDIRLVNRDYYFDSTKFNRYFNFKPTSNEIAVKKAIEQISNTDKTDDKRTT